MTDSSDTMTSAADATERYERLLEVQSLMARVSREIGPAVDLDQVLSTVLAAMRDLVPFDGGIVTLLQDDDLVVAASEPPMEQTDRLRLARRNGIVGRVIDTGVSELSADLRVDPLLPPALRRASEEHGLVSYLCVPLVCLGDTIGAVQVFAGRRDAFNEEHRVLLDGLATQVAGAIESARRYRMITELEVLKSDFLSRVSHELRTPITIMGGFVSTLLSNHERLDHDTRHRMLQRVDVATARLSGLIDELLMLSRLEAGVVTATMEPVPVASLFGEVRRQAQVPAAVVVDCAHDLVIETDASLVVRALGFLVDNALKYAGACSLVAHGTTIEVIDAGPGIPDDLQSRLFERFTRANHDTTVAGMGIGLPMSRTLLAAAGADLRMAEPATGVGTRLVATFAPASSS